MSETNGIRIAAWRDSLSSDELDVVDRLAEMPQGMQVGYVYVMLRREIDRVREPVWRTGLSRLGYVLGGLLMGLVGPRVQG